MWVQRWEFIKERFYENKKENTLLTMKKSKFQEKKKDNTHSTKKKEESKHANNQEKK